MAGRIAPETEAKIKQLYEEGYIFEKIAPMVGHHVATVIRAFHRSGGISRPKNFYRKGVKNGRWKGGKRIVNGYKRVWIPDDHKFAMFKTKANCIAEHRLVMMEHLERPLLPNETVHHMNGDKLDNRIENLQVIVGNHGAGRAFCCADCGSKNLKPLEIINAKICFSS